jgi:hypothetical protein
VFARNPEILEMACSGEKARVTRDGIAQGDSRIQRAQDDGLPATARQAGDGDAFGVRVRMFQQNIQPAREGEVEGGKPAGAAEIELIHLCVMVVGTVELPHPQPFGIEGEHAAFGFVDAANLFVRNGFSDRFVAVDVQDDGDLA